MTLTIVLICCLPAGLILLVFFAIGTAGARTFRMGKRAYADFKPYINDLSQQVTRAQDMTTNFADRSTGLTNTLEEIGGRWAFIVESLSETRNNPVIGLADMAGKFTRRK